MVGGEDVWGVDGVLLDLGAGCWVVGAFLGGVGGEGKVCLFVCLFGLYVYCIDWRCDVGSLGRS